MITRKLYVYYVQRVLQKQSGCTCTYPARWKDAIHKQKQEEEDLKMAQMHISDAIRHIGVNDPELDLFESQYILEKGMAYNSYVILDEKTAVMDTADAHVEKIWEENLLRELDGRKPDYLIIQHLEPDHSGGIERLAGMFPEMKLVGSAGVARMLPQFTDSDLSGRFVTVKEGEELSLGTHTLSFVAAPMVHWPEVMMTYEKSERVLFSADAFGKFGTWDADEDWACEARRYYFGIVGKYGAQVQNVLKKAAQLDISVIAPLHGPVLKENLSYYIGLYDTWSSYKPETKGVFIACASIHGNTLRAANILADLLREKGEEVVELSDLCREDMAECVEDAFRYDRMVLMASSYDAGVFLPMADFLTHLSAKAFQNRTIGLVQNTSWAPSAVTAMKKQLEQMKDIRILAPEVTIKTRVREADKEALSLLADALIAAGK